MTDGKEMLANGFQRVLDFEYVLDGGEIIHHINGQTLPTYALEEVGCIQYLDRNGKKTWTSEFAGQRVGIARARLAGRLAAEGHPRYSIIAAAMDAMPSHVCRHRVEDVLSIVADGVVGCAHGQLYFEKLYSHLIKEGSRLLCLSHIDLDEDGYIAEGEAVLVTGFIDGFPIIQGKNGRYLENDVSALEADFRLVYKFKEPR